MDRTATRTDAAGHSQDDLAEQIKEAAIAGELGDPDIGQSAIDRIINRFVEILGVGVLVTIVSLVFFNAVSRYALRSPIIWSDELVISLIPWLAMCGVFLSVRRRQLIRIDFFVGKLSPAIATTVTTMAYVLSAAAFVQFAFISFEFVSLFGGDRTIYLKLPTGWFTSSLVIGSVAVAVAFLVNAVLVARERAATRTTVRRTQ